MYAALIRHYPGYTLKSLAELTFLQIHLLLDQMIEQKMRENGDDPDAADNEIKILPNDPRAMDAFFGR